MSVAQLSGKRRGDIRCQVHVQMQRSRDDRHAPLGPALWERRRTSETDRKTAAIRYYITGSHLTRTDRRLDDCHSKKTAMQKKYTWETQTHVNPGLMCARACITSTHIWGCLSTADTLYSCWKRTAFNTMYFICICRTSICLSLCLCLLCLNYVELLGLLKVIFYTKCKILKVEFIVVIYS